mgnify:CR=1 FL=1
MLVPVLLHAVVVTLVRCQCAFDGRTSTSMSVHTFSSIGASVGLRFKSVTVQAARGWPGGRANWQVRLRHLRGLRHGQRRTVMHSERRSSTPSIIVHSSVAVIAQAPSIFLPPIPRPPPLLNGGGPGRLCPGSFKIWVCGAGCTRTPFAKVRRVGVRRLCGPRGSSPGFGDNRVSAFPYSHAFRASEKKRVPAGTCYY